MLRVSILKVKYHHGQSRRTSWVWSSWLFVVVMTGVRFQDERFELWCAAWMVWYEIHVTLEVFLLSFLVCTFQVRRRGLRARATVFMLFNHSSQRWIALPAINVSSKFWTRSKSENMWDGYDFFVWRSIWRFLRSDNTHAIRRELPGNLSHACCRCSARDFRTWVRTASVSVVE